LDVAAVSYVTSKRAGAQQQNHGWPENSSLGHSYPPKRSRNPLEKNFKWQMANLKFAICHLKLPRIPVQNIS
jgi:hypothetical protein